MKTSMKLMALAVVLVGLGEIHTVCAQVQFPVPLPGPPFRPKLYRGFMPSSVPTPANDNTGTGIPGTNSINQLANPLLNGVSGGGQLGALGARAR